MANIMLAIQRADTFLLSINDKPISAKESDSITPINTPDEPVPLKDIDASEPTPKKVKFNFEAGTSEFSAIVSSSGD
eukprot:scaffold189413_cov64-Attheya_sp.AAC.1